jgi:hypothetical protein
MVKYLRPLRPVFVSVDDYVRDRVMYVDGGYGHVFDPLEGDTDQLSRLCLTSEWGGVTGLATGTVNKDHMTWETQPSLAGW